MTAGTAMAARLAMACLTGTPAQMGMAARGAAVTVMPAPRATGETAARPETAAEAGAWATAMAGIPQTWGLAAGAGQVLARGPAAPSSAMT